jgi:hypothetical protein
VKTNQLGILFLSAATTLFVAACGGRDSSSNPDASKQPDGANNGPDAPPGTPDAAVAGCAGVYTTSSVAAMRQGTVSGCFEMDNVISIGTTPSTKSPKLYVQDAGGGMFSAMMTSCSSTSTAHPCTVSAQVAAIATGRSVTVQGTYIKSKSTGYENFYIDTITDNGAGTAPAAATATLGDVSRGGTNKGLAFQRVTATISGSDPLVMYDWTPAEFVYTGATKCPYQFGFGMIPKSANATATMACTNGTSQPAGQTTPNAAEILVGTDFYKGFTLSSDCQCAKMFSDMEPAAGSQLKGSISGILVFDVPFGGTTGYYYIAPQSGADAAISGTVAGM